LTRSRIHIKEFKSSRIPDQIFSIPDPGVTKAPEKALAISFLVLANCFRQGIQFKLTVQLSEKLRNSFGMKNDKNEQEMEIMPYL
jgi:hypothetical protein